VALARLLNIDNQLVITSHTKYWNRAVSSTQDVICKIWCKGHQAVIHQYVNSTLQSLRMQREQQLT